MNLQSKRNLIFGNVEDVLQHAAAIEKREKAAHRLFSKLFSALNASVKNRHTQLTEDTVKCWKQEYKTIYKSKE